MTEHACETSGCTEPATFVVYWPGQTRRMCAAHAARATRVAEAMGFSLTTKMLLLALVLLVPGCSFEHAPGARPARSERAERIVIDAAHGRDQADAAPPELELDAQAFDAGEQLDAAPELELDAQAFDAGDPFFPQLDAGKDCGAVCRDAGATGGHACTADQLPGHVLCCCEAS